MAALRTKIFSRTVIAAALQCAVTMAVLAGLIGMIAWAAGIASPADLPWILSGVFAGSFVRALYPPRRSRG